MTINETLFTAIDFESAGTAPGKTDAPVQVGTCSWSPNTGITDTWISYIHTEQDITWSAQKVHGITRQDLRHAPKLMMLWPKIKKRLKNHAVVAHGHGTEKRFLNAFPGHGFGPWIDTLQLTRAAWPELPSHSLGDLCISLQLEEKVNALVPKKTWHDALYDAVASVVLLEKIIADFSLEQAPLSCLESPDTRAWHALRP
ncbi:exonuclease domain-containing protein [Rubritalea tangerina]|uniref:Exonuclease domain-containing protein n=1 Tax=Rubritalea tangerina TaxID=430798 RepID=A0ABW4ZB29_9BACT